MFNSEKQDSNSLARIGHIETPHGLIETPAYVIVGTHGRVKTLNSEDLTSAKIQMIISNTYHLWRDLGEEGLNDFSGLHNTLGWEGPVMTDSGGFQVFSLGFLKENNMRGFSKVDGKIEPKSKGLVRVTEAGVYFKPEASEEGEEPEEIYLDAEMSIKIQEQLGADIMVAFDEPTSPSLGHAETASAMQRTHNWAERSLEAKESQQKIYGVVQGGAYEDLRTASAKFIGSLPFDGFAIGSTYGDGYGGTKNQTADMLKWSIPHLPKSKPRHLFGVGRIEDLLAGVEAGIDTFDCVIPTREARHGAIWTADGRFDVTKGIYGSDRSPLDPECDCPVCVEENLNRGHLYQLFKSKDPEAGRLATLHNVYFFNTFMEKIRDAIRNGRFGEFKKESLQKLIQK